MSMQRFWTPLAVAAFLAALWLGERGLCSCGGPSAPPAGGSATPTATTPAAGTRPVAGDSAAPARPDLDDASWIKTPSAEGKYLFVWRPDPAPIVRNQDFALDLWVFVDGEPRQLQSLEVTAWMPDHGHGMLRAVRPEARPDGSYRVENMLFHMRGQWRIVFDAIDAHLSERGEHALEL